MKLVEVERDPFEVRVDMVDAPYTLQVAGFVDHDHLVARGDCTRKALTVNPNDKWIE